MFKDPAQSLIAVINHILSVAVDSDSLFKSLSEFNPDMFDNVTRIMTGAVRSVAYTLLSLFFMLELLHLSTKTEGMNQSTMSIEVVFKAMFKMVLCKLAVDQVGNVMDGIYEVSLFLSRGVSAAVTTPGGGPALLDMAYFGGAITAMGIGGQLVTVLMALLVLLITGLVALLVNVIIVARFIEIYIMLAISPIPIATLAHEEHSAIAKGFLKSFAAVCLQGVLLFIVLSFFPLLGNVNFLKALPGSDSSLQLLSSLGYSILLALAVFSSQKWAKRICNAM